MFYNCIIIIIIFLYYHYNNINRIYYHYNNINRIYDYDIVCAPGGNYGFYMLGICHFIKNNYNIKDKKIIGFSAGSFITIFLSLKNELLNILLLNIFKYKIYCNTDIKTNLLSIKNNFLETIKINDLDLNNKSIGITNNNLTLNIIDNFVSVKDIMDACIGSSFVPYITYSDVLYFYRGKCCIDGGIVYYKILKKKIKKNKKKILIISYEMFNRWKGGFIKGLKKKNISSYDLYILGYHDALKHKKILDNYLMKK